MSPLCIVVDLQVAANNIKPLNVAMVTQQWVHFAVVKLQNISYCS
jgi:hypothetical protein